MRPRRRRFRRRLSSRPVSGWARGSERGNRRSGGSRPASSRFRESGASSLKAMNCAMNSKALPPLHPRTPDRRDRARFPPCRVARGCAGRAGAPVGCAPSLHPPTQLALRAFGFGACGLGGAVSSASGAGTERSCLSGRVGRIRAPAVRRRSRHIARRRGVRTRRSHEDVGRRVEEARPCRVEVVSGRKSAPTRRRSAHAGRHRDSAARRSASSALDRNRAGCRGLPRVRNGGSGRAQDTVGLILADN